MADYKLEDSVYILFTTRAFATGIPGVLSAATVAVYEDVTATPIETSIAVTETLNSINGLNAVTIAALAASGYNAGGHYHIVIEAGTVDSVSVVGEVVGSFSIEAAPVNWAKVSAPATAVDLSGTDIQLVDTVTTYTNNTLQTGDVITAINDLANATDGLTAIKAVVDAIPTTAMRGTDGVDTATMRGTDSAALASVATESRLAELDAANLPATTDAAVTDLANATDGLGALKALLDAIPTTMRGTDNAALASEVTAARMSELDAGTAGKMANQVDIVQTDTTTDIPALIAALNDLAATDVLSTALTESYNADGSTPTLTQALCVIMQVLTEKTVAGTTTTIKKLDGSTTALTLTLNDGTSPTSITRAT